VGSNLLPSPLEGEQATTPDTTVVAVVLARPDTIVVAFVLARTRPAVAVLVSHTGSFRKDGTKSWSLSGSSLGWTCPASRYLGSAAERDQH
jgi:hypothetical protein